MKTEQCMFQNRNLNLEGIMHKPEINGDRLPGVVLCHPHPLYGGDMDNSVVVAVSRALSERGIITFRFNFRGVGLSEGVFDNGKGEQDDLRAAIAVLEKHPKVDPNRLGIAGYSFGGMVVLSAAKSIKQLRALAGVSPVIIPGLLKGLSIPAYFICGVNDHVVSSELLISEAETMTPPGQVEVVPVADHFWDGFEAEMAGKVAAFFESVL